jgi:hypothetical protein
MPCRPTPWPALPPRASAQQAERSFMRHPRGPPTCRRGLMRLFVHPPLRLGTCARSRLRIQAAPSSRDHSMRGRPHSVRALLSRTPHTRTCCSTSAARRRSCRSCCRIDSSLALAELDTRCSRRTHRARSHNLAVPFGACLLAGRGRSQLIEAPQASRPLLRPLGVLPGVWRYMGVRLLDTCGTEGLVS